MFKPQGGYCLPTCQGVGKKRGSGVSKRGSYKAYMRSLWSEHAPRVCEQAQSGRHFREESLEYDLRKLGDAWRVIRAVESGVPLTAFTDGALREVVQDTSHALGRTERLLDRSGLLTLLDRQYDDMAAELRAKDLPVEELDILRAYGFDLTEDDLTRIVYTGRNRAARSRRDIRPSSAFALSREACQDAIQALNENEERSAEFVRQMSDYDKHRGGSDKPIPRDRQPPKRPERQKPRIFKGLGQIVQGGAMTLADIGLAAGVFHFPVSPETQTWGALASVTAGVGSIMGGVGDIRGE